MTQDSLNRAYDHARERYAELGVDTDAALAAAGASPISLHCWQGDDVGGFESAGRSSAAAWRSPATIPARRARPTSCAPTREKAFALIPGRHRFNLHAFYGEFGGKRVDRDAIDARAFRRLDRLGASGCGIGLDFNPTCFSHPKAADSFTLSHADPAIREFWIEHGIACRRIGAAIGKALGHALRHERLDSRRLQGHADRPRRAARAAARLARRHLRREHRPAPQPRRRGGQAVRHRLRELHRRLARVLSRLRA